MKRKPDEKPKKVLITFEAELNPTRCCECTFGGTCPYVCSFANKLDCGKYDLGSIKLMEVKDAE